MNYPTTGNRIDEIDLTKWGIDTTCQLSLLRTDLNNVGLMHPNNQLLNGNKLYKLKHNISFVKENNVVGLLTFGGAFSNHLHAVAAAGNLFNFKTIGIVRGEEWQKKSNPTLDFCVSTGMQFKFWSRTNYRQKTLASVVEQLINDYPNYLIVPEGGNNALALKGTKEILDKTTTHFNTICCPVGTGGTLAGIYLTKQIEQALIGFASVKMLYKTALQKILQKENTEIKEDLLINYDYTFGGFAKTNQPLIKFINRFKAIYNIQLEPLYTGKMLFGIFEMITNKCFESNQKILAIHTGGLQGIKGFNQLNENILC